MILQYAHRSIVTTLLIVGLSFVIGCTTKSTTSISNFEGSTVSSEVDTQKAASERVAAARAYLQRQNLERAKFHLDKARNHDDSYPDLYYTLGFYHQMAGQPDMADDAFKKAIRLDRSNPEYKNGYGQFLCNSERYKAAEKYYQSAIDAQTYSNVAHAYYNLGVCMLKQQKKKDATALLRKALNINPKFAAALLEMADLEFMEKRYRRTNSYLNRFREVARANPRSLWLGLRVSYFLGDKDSVSSYAIKLEQMFPESEQTARYLENQSSWQ